MIRRVAAGVALAAIVFAPGAAAQTRFPQFSNYVVDAVGVVPDDVEQQINAQLADFERRMKSQVAVAVIESTGNDSLEDYTIDLARYWGVGRKGDDNGVLLLIAYADRRIRIEVGRKVEDELTDLQSGRIINDYMVPLMREGNVGEAVQTGTNEIRRALGDTEVGEAPPPPRSEPEGYDVPAWALFVPFLIFGPLGRFFSRRGRRRSGWVTPVFWGGWGGLGGGFGDRRSGGGGGGGFSGGGGGGFGGGGASGGW